jgi:hypothetical protein
MLDFDSLAEMECLDQGLTEPPPVPTNEGGWGWSALFGGALGLMLGRSDRPSVSVPEFAPAEGDFTPDEKDFLSQLWRFERELRDVRENEDWERLYFLSLLAVESFKQGWSEFVPENPGYSPSPRFDQEVRQILTSFIRLCQEALALDFDTLISPKKFGKLDEYQVNLNYATMTLTVHGVPFSSEQPKPSTQSL